MGCPGEGIEDTIQGMGPIIVIAAIVLICSFCLFLSIKNAARYEQELWAKDFESVARMPAERYGCVVKAVGWANWCEPFFQLRKLWWVEIRREIGTCSCGQNFYPRTKMTWALVESVCQDLNRNSLKAINGMIEKLNGELDAPNGSEVLVRFHATPTQQAQTD